MRKTSLKYTLFFVLFASFVSISFVKADKDNNCEQTCLSFNISENSQQTNKKAAKKYIVVTADDVCLRSVANESGKLTGPNNRHYSNGAELEYTGVEGEYYKVLVDGKTYYFPKKYASVKSNSNTASSNSQGTNAKKITATEWLSKVRAVSLWYASNFKNYQQFLNGKMCPLVNKKVRDDCSGLVTACLLNMGIYNGNTIYNSTNFRDKNSAVGKLLQKYFTPISGKFMQTDYQKFKPGDILAGYMYENGKVQYNHGHVTVYAGNGKFYDWGGWAYKSKTQPVAGEESAGYMHDHQYTIIWRLK